MPSTRDIVRRIKSVKNTKKITKAMEMVASSKMRRAVNKLYAARPYSNLAWEMLKSVSHKTQIELHALLAPREEIKKVAVILVTSNRGLCGSFNQLAIKKALDYIRQKSGATVEVLAMGKKGSRTLAKGGYAVSADFDKADVVEDTVAIRPLAKMAIAGYLASTYDEVVMVYTDFISSLRQIPRVKRLLPFSQTQDKELGQTAAQADEDAAKKLATENTDTNAEFLFEPDAKAILDVLLPRLLEVQIYQALLESNASEHSARMLAMRNASDNAGEMIDELTLVYNQARQAAITKEIAEIAGGKAALE